MKSPLQLGASFLCVSILVFAVAAIWHPKPRPGRAYSEGQFHDPVALLTQANHFSWLGNWYAAGPLYGEAEERFHNSGDNDGEAYARIGRIRSQATRMPINETLGLLTKELSTDAVRHNPGLRMWCLALRGSIAIDIDSKAAKGDWTEALQLARRLGEQQWAARATGELGVFAFLDGNTASAVSMVGKAILSAYRSGDAASQVRLLSMLGFGFNEERRYSEALVMFKRAIATAEATPDTGFPFLAYRGESAALAGLGQNAPARQLLNKALSVARTEHDAVHESDTLLQAGELELAENKIVEGETSIRQASRIAEQLNLLRTLEESLFDLAGVERQLGDAQAATRALRRGINVSKRLGDLYYLPRDLTALAELRVSQHKFRAADRLYDRAEDVLDAIVANQHSFEEGTAHAGSMSPTYLGHFRLEQRVGGVARAFQVIERVRGRIVASKLFVREQSGAKSPKIAKLEGDIAATQLSLLRTEGVKARSSLMEQLLADERNLAFELNESGLHRQDILARPVPVKTLQNILNEDEALAEYVLDEPMAFCTVITRHSKKLVTLPAGRNEIRDLTSSYLSELRAKRSDDQGARELYRILLEPVIKAFPRSRVIISPDGILYALPFEALRDERGFVVRSKVISYTPSGTVLWRLRNSRVQRGARPLLAVGAVHFRLERALPKNYPPDSLGAVMVRGIAELSGSHLEDLPGSRDEVLAIAQLAGPNSELLLEKHATETEFKSQPLADFRVIHLATHAMADVQYPDRAALILGIASHTPDDGFLQVREIMSLPLRADLVTLSACDTNMGTQRGEAGVVSLEQAFLIAGARAVVASLWNVEDRSTTTLMKAFYTHLAQHEDKVLALTSAKRDMLDRYGDLSPYYWAPFVMVGEGSQPVSFGR